MGHVSRQFGSLFPLGLYGTLTFSIRWVEIVWVEMEWRRVSISGAKKLRAPIVNHYLHRATNKSSQS